MEYLRRKETEGELGFGEHVASGLILLGLVAVLLSMVFGASGCTAAVTRENTQLKAQQREVVAALTRAREGLRSGAQQVASLEQELARMRRRIAARDRDLELVRAQLVTAHERIDAQSQAAQTALGRTREALLSQCRTLPTAREMLSQLRRRGEKRVKILARHETSRFLLLVAVVGYRRPEAEVRALYQTKLMREPASVVLARVGEGRSGLRATAAGFLGRFVRIDLQRQVRVDRRAEQVKALHFVLRPGDAGVELACMARGDELRRGRRKGSTTFTRVVRFLPPKAGEAAFQLRVMNASMSEEIARSGAAAHGSKLWRYELGESGRCARTLVGRLGQRYALEGLH